MSYGSGAVMAVPAHDERDFEFATINLALFQSTSHRCKGTDDAEYQFRKLNGKNGTELALKMVKLVNSAEFDGFGFPSRF